MPSTIEFIKKVLLKDNVYDMWLSQIDNLERSTISQSSEDRTAVDNSLNLGFQLFPIIDSVSYNLFGKNGRHYLKELGYTDQEADLIFTIFRNGQISVDLAGNHSFYDQDFIVLPAEKIFEIAGKTTGDAVLNIRSSLVTDEFGSDFMYKLIYRGQTMILDDYLIESFSRIVTE